VTRIERNRGLGRAFEKAVRRKPLARRMRVLCKLNGPKEMDQRRGVAIFMLGGALEAHEVLSKTPRIDIPAPPPRVCPVAFPIKASDHPDTIVS
jgi:hypothetical protein